MRAVASSPPCFAARLPDVFAGKLHVDVAYAYTLAEHGDDIALGHHTILRGSLASPTTTWRRGCQPWCMIHTRCNMKPYPKCFCPATATLRFYRYLGKVGSEAAKVVADSARAEAEAVVGQNVCLLHAQES